MGNITSANSNITLTVPGLLATPVVITKFSTDKSISSDAETIAETRMGVDGQIAYGYLPPVVSITIDLEADSPSIGVIDKIVRTSKLNKRPYSCDMIVEVNSTRKRYKYTNGVIVEVKTMPDHSKMLDPVSVKFTFEKSATEDF